MSQEEIQRYEKMLAEDPQSRAFAPLAEIHRKGGRLDEAIRIARAGLEIHPGYSGGLVVLGRSLYEKGELDNAAEVLRKAVHETPESYLGQKFLAKVLLDRGENEGALQALEAAHLLSPEDDEVAHLLEGVRGKITAPPTVEFQELPGGAAEVPEIVTYEQKPTTIDGVELPPLPKGEPAEPFSFSEEELPGKVQEQTAAEEVLIDPDEGGLSAEELGPEAAAFIEEGEAIYDVSLEDLEEVEEEDLLVDGREAVQAAPQPGRAPEVARAEPGPDVMVREVPGAGPGREAARVMEAEGEPGLESGLAEDFLEEEGLPVSGAVPEIAPPWEGETGVYPPAESGTAGTGDREVPFQPEYAEGAMAVEEFPPLVHEGAPPAEEPIGAGKTDPLSASQSAAAFSTETLADLYAQQGFGEKAAQIYRQMLTQDPGNEAVRSKLRALEGKDVPTQAVPRGERPPDEPAPSGPGDGKEKDILSVLEGWLDNVERMKGP